MQVFEEVLGNPSRLAALSGPNHAEEVVLGIPAGTVIASPNNETACFFRDLFTTSTFRCYTSEDYIGVELCAAYKNVIAIAVGASYGMGLSLIHIFTSIMTIGLGMIGSSFVMAYRAAYPDSYIIGVDISQDTIDEAQERGWINDCLLYTSRCV